MIDRKTVPVFGVERRLRVSPHISSLPGRQGMSCMGRLHKSRKDYSIMHIKAFKLPDKNPLFYPKNRVFEEDYTGYRRSTMPTHIHPVSGMAQRMCFQAQSFGLIPQIGTDLITILILEAMSQNNCCTVMPPQCTAVTNFTTKRIVPF